MNINSYTGVCFCKETNGHSDSFDPTELVSFIKTIPNVKIVWHQSDVQLSEPNALAERIQDNQLDRIVIAGKSPGHLKSFFSRAMSLAAKDPGNISLASFNEFGIISKKDTPFAKAILASVIYDISIDEIIFAEDVSVNPNTVVIGAGIAGIQAALEIADGGNKVFLIERTATIGGHMAMFDKTFPMLDCAACILTPKMVQVDQHPNIELLL